MKVGSEDKLLFLHLAMSTFPVDQPMNRTIKIGAAQSGPVTKNASRKETLDRLIDLLRQGKSSGCEFVVFTECALTAFFPHWEMGDGEVLDDYFEANMPNGNTQALFDEAEELGIGFHLGYAELAKEDGEVKHYNTAIIVNAKGEIVSKYRKIHLPGYREPQPDQAFQNLEKMYFDTGNLGFPVCEAFGGRLGMCICYDRRWPESYRVLALQGAELICIGYNTPSHDPEKPGADALVNFQSLLTMQAGAYNNSAWVIGVAKAGTEEGVQQMGQSAIIAPSGEVVAMASSLGDELIVANCDLEMALQYKKETFNFDNRHPEYYGLITSRKV